MSVLNPLDHPDLYDGATLQGVRLPGLVKVEGAAAAAAYDKVKGKGTSGSTEKFAGTETSDFTIKVLLTEPAHFDAFERDIRPMLRAAIPEGEQKEPPKAYAFEHPETTKLQITRVTVKKVSQLELVDPSGLFGYTLNVSKYAPAAATTGGGLLKVKAAAAGETGKPEAAQADPNAGLKNDVAAMKRKVEAEATKLL